MAASALATGGGDALRPAGQAQTSDPAGALLSQARASYQAASPSRSATVGWRALPRPKHSSLSWRARWRLP